MAKVHWDDGSWLHVFQPTVGPSLLTRVHTSRKIIEEEFDALQSLDHPSIPKPDQLILVETKEKTTAEIVYKLVAKPTLRQWLNSCQAPPYSDTRLVMAKRVCVDALTMLNAIDEEYTNFDANRIILHDPVVFLGWEEREGPPDALVKVLTEIITNSTEYHPQIEKQLQDLTEERDLEKASRQMSRLKLS